MDTVNVRYSPDVTSPHLVHAHARCQLLRYGGSWGIESGRRGNAEILSFWEKSGCLISNPQSSVSKCSDSSRVMHEARMHGLATLLQSVFSSMEQVSSAT
jgi:hypothetical protein